MGGQNKNKNITEIHAGYQITENVNKNLNIMFRFGNLNILAHQGTKKWIKSFAKILRIHPKGTKGVKILSLRLKGI